MDPLITTPDLLTVVNTLMLLLIAIITAYTSSINKTTKEIAVKTYELSQKTELNTNSMKDSLVAATKAAAFAEGKADQLKDDSVKEAMIIKTISDRKNGAVKG